MGETNKLIKTNENEGPDIVTDMCNFRCQGTKEVPLDY